jgi:hypothetical protein
MQTEFRFASKKEKVKVDALIFGSVKDAFQPIRRGGVWMLKNEIVERRGKIPHHDFPPEVLSFY